MGSVSGSLSLDLTRLEEAVVRGVAETILPGLAQISADVAAMNGAAVLGEIDMAPTLASCLPAGIASERFPRGIDVGHFQALKLKEAGYAVVAVSGPALEAVKASNARRAEEARADTRLAQANRNGSEDSWFEGS